MALNLSTLTSSATSGDVLAEALTTADFLENVPVLRNLARGSQKGGDAKQDVALNQPKALPLIDGKGYCYLPVTTGNAPAVTFPTIGANDDFVLEMDVYLVSGTNLHFLSGANADHRLAIYNGSFYIGGFNASLSSPLALGVSNIKIERTSGTITLKQNDAVIASRASSSALTFTHLSFNGQFSTSILPLNGYIQKATLSIGGTEQLNIDFTATNVRHGDTKFKCATGQVVTINQSGNDPATIIKKPVLRFAGTNSAIGGLLNQTIDSGYFFAAFSVLGNGGESTCRVFAINSTGQAGHDSTGFIVSARLSTDDIASYYAGWKTQHDGMFDDTNGDILHEIKFQAGAQRSRANNADERNRTDTMDQISAEEYTIAAASLAGADSANIDLEYLALFPATITDDQADSVRNFINNRNNVFSLVDNGFYFFDPQKATFTGNFTGSNTLDGYIIGSDNGDTDVRSNLTLEQGTLNDQPSTDGYTITFNDAAEHLEFENGASQNLSGWQVVGTSLGTFAYRVNNTAVSELNLLGNAGSASFRKAGSLYGIILLPESASSADIESARKLLIDRGASDGDISGISFSYAWLDRTDIVEFKSIRLSNTVNFTSAWHNSTSLNSFGAIDASNGSNFSSAFRGTSALKSFPSGAKLGTSASNVNFTDAWRDSGLQSFPALDLSKGINLTRSWFYTPLASFGAIDASNSTNFSSAWHGTALLTSFPAGAKLGTEATGTVIFDNAWNSSGITSFSTPLPTATSVSVAWGYCSALTQFNLDSLPLVLNVSQAWRNTGLTSFNTNLPSTNTVTFAWYQATSLSSFGAVDIKSCTDFNSAWRDCSALTSFPSGAKLGTSASNVNFTAAWRNTGLTSFPNDIDLSKGNNFHATWLGDPITSFSTPLPAALDISYAWYQCSSLSSFSTPVIKSETLGFAWLGCSALTDFAEGLFDNWNPSIISTGIFNSTWDGCTSLTAISVENILVSIDASNQHGTDDGTSTGNPLQDSGIDIDYDGTALSAATNTAVDSLKAKGWSIIVNNVTL
jgi:hypothetical protein